MLSFRVLLLLWRATPLSLLVSRLIYTIAPLLLLLVVFCVISVVVVVYAGVAFVVGVVVI